MIIYQWSQVSQLIRFKIDVFDEKFDNDPEAEIENSRPDTMKPGGSFKVGHIILGAVQKHTSFEQVSATHKDDPAFSNFYNKFRQFLRTHYIPELANLDTVLNQKFKVCFQNLSTCHIDMVNGQHGGPDLNAKTFFRYMNIATLRCLLLQKSLGKTKSAISDVIHISITSHATTIYLFLHQTVSSSLNSYLYSLLPRKIELTHGY
jgi:hypothetical protein